jgi:serine/threonine protein kinase
VSHARVRDKLAKIAARPQNEWVAKLQQAFPDDASMRNQALLWLYADHDASETDADPPSLGEPAQQRYELSVRLDSGATASVWQAYDRKLGRNVAIKVFHGTGHSDAIDQIISEAQAASDVTSARVVRVLDVHADDARPFIVMELVAEHDPERGELVLGEAASSCTPKSIEESVRWVMDVARGVHDAHLRNVFHRDLKPRNVLVTPMSRRAHVADFGLAVSGTTESTTGESTAGFMTRGPNGPVTVRGTPAYMAPEQAVGLPMSLDPREAADRATLVAVDVWGLGAILYDLIGGRPPWTATTQLGAWEVAASGEPPPPLLRTAGGDRVSRRLRRIVEKAMALDPRGRYASAAQVANELQAYLDRKPTIHDRSRLVRLGLWCRRNPQLALTALVAITLTLTAVASYSIRLNLRQERNALREEVAEQQRERASLAASVEQSRTDLATTQAKLGTQRTNLAALEASLAEERMSYEALVEAKEKALREANTATRQLVDRLEAAQRARVAAEQSRASYEQLLGDAKREVQRLVTERDRIRKEREASRKERESLQRQLDVAISERESIAGELQRLREDLAKLEGGQPVSARRERRE